MGPRNGLLILLTTSVRTQSFSHSKLGSEEHLVYLPGPEEKEKRADEHTAASTTGK